MPTVEMKDEGKSFFQALQYCPKSVLLEHIPLALERLMAPNQPFYLALQYKNQDECLLRPWQLRGKEEKGNLEAASYQQNNLGKGGCIS